MGVGKSTLGKNLSIKLGFQFFDTDKEIEKEKGMTINDIFNNFGESYFRSLEEKVTLRLLEKQESVVISLGGGAYLNDNIREKLKKKTISIWLDTDIQIIISRLKKSKNIRPIAIKLKSNDDIEKLFNSRNQVYKKADIRLNISTMGKTRILELAIKQLKEYLMTYYAKT